MTANVTSTGGVSDSSYGSARRQPDDKTSVPAAPEAASPAPAGPHDQMLVIEEDPELGGFIYITIDRRTGAVIQKFNRTELMKLREAATYAAGAVLSARA